MASRTFTVNDHGKTYSIEIVFPQDRFWRVYSVGQDAHVIPINDRKEHCLFPNCRCNPDAKLEGASIVYVHNAYDLREIVEQANEVIHGGE